MNPTRIVSALLGLVCALPLQARVSDQGDGTYLNPPLYADYPDPDIIRVKDDFYFVTTTFVNTPGLRLLHSKDLVNWSIIAHLEPRLSGHPAYDMEGEVAYRGGVFAPSLRYRDGVFYVAVTINGRGGKTRIYRATDPRGPWTMNELDRAAFDPGLFFDDDGHAYIFTSGGWDGTVTLLTLDRDLTKVIASEKIYFNRGAEGSKVVKRHGYYYLFQAVPSRLALVVSRAKSLRGPWETRPQIDDRTGGHQGAIVDLPDGSDYGFVMRDDRFAGRMTHISPVHWADNWPVWGTIDSPGRVPDKAPKPIPGHPIVRPPTSDEFSAPKPGLQWQWNHNPDDARWSLTERPGWLRLKPTRAKEFWLARNTLTQKGQGPWSRGEVKLDLSGLRPGDVCGFGALGKHCGHIVVSREADGRLVLGMNVIEDKADAGRTTEVRASALPFAADEIYLRMDMDLATGRGRCAYRATGFEWNELGGEFPLGYDWRVGTFQGPQYAVFCYNPEPGSGWVDVDAFRFTDDPARPVSWAPPVVSPVEEPVPAPDSSALPRVRRRK